MNIRSFLFAASVIVLATLHPEADAQPVTFNFTGIVSNSIGSFGSIAVGTAITGTYTLDFAAANPGISTGTVGAPSGVWEARSESGAAYGIAVPSGFVFSSTAQVGAFSYSTGPQQGYQNLSHVMGNNGGTGNFYAFEDTALDGRDRTVSSFSIYPLSTGSGGFSSNGLPVLVTGGLNTGYIDLDVNGVTSELNYTINSLTVAAVPEPETYAMLIAGLGLLGFVGQRMKKPFA